jgi:RHS repeat-associated protein
LSRSEARPDGSTAKSNYDPAGNLTDACYWKPAISVGDCFEAGHSGWTDPPTQVTTSSYDARNNRVALTDSVSGTTTTYDPEHNYAIKAFYVPTGSGKEHQTLFNYDSRHRLATTTDGGVTTLAITEQLCAITSDHSCPSPITVTGSDDYAYDDNDNRTTVDEDNGATSSTSYYCYDALNRLTARKSASGCTGTTSESYSYDDAGNRTQSVTGGLTTNYAYNASGQLCKVGGTSCATPNVTYDSAGRTESYGGWVYEYDAEGRLVTACKSSSCVGSIDKVDFTYDGEGHRTQIREYTSGTLTTTRDFRYQGDAIVEESTNGSVSRGYVVDEQGTLIRFCDPSCASPTASYLVTWNGHGDALAAWQIESDGTLTLANSYTYDSWGTPTTTVASGFADLGLRFLYVGAHDVQWDDFSGVSLYYMHARHYSPAIGRFLQPDPARAEANQYGYAGDNPIAGVDSSGSCVIDVNEMFNGGGGGIWAVIAAFLRGGRARQAPAPWWREAQIKGSAGEAAVRSKYPIGPKTGVTMRVIRGTNSLLQTRFPDGINWTLRTLSEVKNVKFQPWTEQLATYLRFAKDHGLKFVLYTRSNTTTSPKLQQFIDSGEIIHRYIPGL